MARIAARLLTLLCALAPAIGQANGIVHDAEYALLWKQHGERWAAEDREIAAHLDALRQKHGKRPNVIHIM